MAGPGQFHVMAGSYERMFDGLSEAQLQQRETWHQLQRRSAAVSRHQHESTPEAMTSPGSPASTRSAPSASRISPAPRVGRVVIVRIEALAPQLGRSPRSNSSSRRSSAVLIEVSVGSRVAGPDRSVGGLLDQGQLRFAGHGRLRVPGAVWQSKSRNVGTPDSSPVRLGRGSVVRRSRSVRVRVLARCARSADRCAFGGHSTVRGRRREGLE